MLGIKIRPLEGRDIRELVEMEAGIFSRPWSQQHFTELLTRPYCQYLVAETEAAVAGCAGLVNLCGEGEIDKVMVEESLRGRGIASALLGELIDRGRAQGITAFTLEVRAGNVPAIRLYEKFGFQSEGIRPRFYDKPVEDALIMWRREENTPAITMPPDRKM